LTYELVTGTSTPYPYNQTEYLFHLSQARFGLCLRGYGPKCNREIELMAMGTVLIVTPDVDMKNYFDPPVNGDHYLVVRSPDELSRVIQELPDNEWERMSRNCRDWYRKPFV
jgi:glycosyltransferase involved in cell wall biosynthesis